MSKAAFKEFIKQEKVADSQQKNINWDEKKRAYLKHLDTLFKDIKLYLQEFIKSGEVRIEDTAKIIEEEHIGKYEAPGLFIHLYGKHAGLVPVGANIIGSPGRVDLVGGFDRIRFVLADKKDERPAPFAGISWTPEGKKLVRENAEKWLRRERNFVWKMITNPPDIRYIDLNEDSFLSSLQEVLDG